MIILNCPKCSEAVTLAGGVRDSARVRCPLCQEEYVVSEALGKLPPTLIVIDAAVATDETERPLEPTWETSSDAAASGASTAAFAFTSERTATSTAASGAPRIATKPRPKRKPKNPAIEGVKVVGGGIAGLLIAQLILWWFPVTKYRRDPFELGPKVAKSFLGFLVSPDFKGDDLTADESGDVSGKPRGSTKGSGGGLGGGLGPDNQPYSEDLGKPSVDWNAVIKNPKDDGAGQASGKKPVASPADDDLIIDDLNPKAPADAGLGGIKVDLEGAPSPRVKPSPAAKPTPSAKPATSEGEREVPAKPVEKAKPEESKDEPATQPAPVKAPPAEEKPAEAKPAEKGPDKPSEAPKPGEPNPDAKPSGEPSAKPDDSSPGSPE